MNKSKSMTAVAAVLALCMAGSAFADDRHGDRHGNRHDDRRDRYVQQHHGDDRGHRDFRHDRRAEWRGDHRPHAEWRRGGYVPREYRGRGYVVEDWRARRLQAPPQGYQWVGVGSEFALAAIATGLIAQIIVNQ
ncbi:MAG: RcnB family protein [Gammaproteobacteria bacterium]|nr:RcnB family protein [Gammaproteobacteria bacterium]MBU1443417.1 RcnB family protein [Gammaproteobacteria bacterium]MBU2287681.1 RcnB family protein [Gammaproteobacteria bacterium]MBU2407617.1 RcnB family protein [Gammaproteobacteria bacterium]